MCFKQIGINLNGFLYLHVKLKFTWMDDMDE